MNKTETISTKKGWIARDRDNELWFFSIKPYKEYSSWRSESCWKNGEDYEMLDSELFPEITWEDEEPVKVEIKCIIKTID